MDDAGQQPGAVRCVGCRWNSSSLPGARCTSDDEKLGDLAWTLPIARIIAITVAFWVSEELLAEVLDVLAGGDEANDAAVGSCEKGLAIG